MSYQAQAIKVMIASPSDVANEREIARVVLAEWNCIHSEHRKQVLMPIGWETHVPPEMGSPPQPIINNRILKGCDLLVAMFWTRIGTPTSKAVSGTAEEIKEHMAAGKPAMLYFSSTPVRPESVDRDQWEALQEFKKGCIANGVIETYDSLSEFREKFTRQLAQRVIQAFPSGQTTETPSNGNLSAATRSALSPDARELLINAASDPNGQILVLLHSEGLTIQTNGRGFTVEGNPESEARWTAAIMELKGRNLISDIGSGEVYQVTHEGFYWARALD